MTAPPPDALPNLLRNAASAVQARDDARHYLNHPPPDRWGVNVDWTWGGSFDVHRVIRPLISAKVEALMPRLLQEAAEDLGREADRSMAALNKALRAELPQ